MGSARDLKSLLEKTSFWRKSTRLAITRYLLIFLRKDAYPLRIDSSFLYFSKSCRSSLTVRNSYLLIETKCPRTALQ